MKDKCSQIRPQSRIDCFVFEFDQGEAFQNMAPWVFGYRLS